MRIEMKPIQELKPAAYNPRVALKPGMPEYERLKRSLSEFELVQPLVWNERTGQLVGGHQRLAILLESGATEVPVVVVSLSLEREQALNVALNNEQVAGHWDTGKLQDLLRDLIELPDFDATLTGFSEQDLNALLMAPVENFTPEETPESADHIVVTLHVDPDDWEAFQAELDDLLGQFELETHIRLPRGQLSPSPPV
ncbi:MAG: ParB N-terminal domain-containing protein [Planctomycetaceae bacterium]|nr:ParB N-terminal domain-containing protein [Planctomycetaceae bacterium]